LDVNGSFGVGITEVNGNHTLANDDHTIIALGAGSVINLGLAVPRRQVIVKNMSGQNITVSGTIDGTATVSITLQPTEAYQFQGA
jgi:hypothetical protein